MATSVKVALKKKLFTTQDTLPATQLLKEFKREVSYPKILAP